jgi:hypothetical protein
MDDFHEKTNQWISPRGMWMFEMGIGDAANNKRIKDNQRDKTCSF